MAEAVAFGASVIAILQISDRIIGLCKFYIGAAQDAPADIRVILLEVSTLNTVVKSLQFLATCNGVVSNAVRSLGDRDGPIDGCRRAVADLEKLFPLGCSMDGDTQPKSKKQKVEATLAALAWPLKANKAKRLLDEVMRYKATISLALTAETTKDIKDIRKRTTQIHEILTDSQREQVYKWLQRTDPSPLHNRARTQYEPSTGGWMLRTPEWKDWIEAKQRCLWIYGIPGAGKTVLMSHLIEQIRQHCEAIPTARRAYAYYYCYFGNNQDETAPFLRWLTVQLCRQADMVPRSIYDMYKRGVEPTIPTLLNVLEDVLRNFKVAYVVVDAIDESNPRDNLLKVLRDLCSNVRLAKLQLLASSREYSDIKSGMQEFSEPIPMDNLSVEHDIKAYVRSTLQSNPKLRRWPDAVQEQVEKALSKRAKGMFRWAVCQIDVLQRLKPETRIIENALKNLPKTLDETYDRIFLSIPDEDRPFVNHALRWIYYYSRIHGQFILCSVLLQAVAKSTSGAGCYQNDYFYDGEILHELCGCLIRMNGDIPDDRSVSFAHYTVLEYISSPRISKGPTAYFAADKISILRLSTEIVFSEALRYALELKRRSGTANMVSDLFKAHCMISSFRAMSIMPHHTFETESLRTLTLRLLDPSEPYFGFLWDATSKFNPSWISSVNLSSRHTPGNFWEFSITSKSKSKATSHLLHHLILSDHCNNLEPLEGFLQSRQARAALGSRLRCKRTPWAESSGTVSHQAIGNIIDIYALLKCGQLGQLKLLLQYGPGLYDPSEVLHYFIGSHDHSLERKAGNFCPLEHLLSCGGDPNGKGYRVTPLQIATLSRDYEGVRILLKAGADPNGTGTSEGLEWPDDINSSRFNYVHGRSPLYICETSRWSSSKSETKEFEAIEKSLRHHGARLQQKEEEGLELQA